MSINLKIVARPNGGQFAPELGGQFDRNMHHRLAKLPKIEANSLTRMRSLGAAGNKIVTAKSLRKYTESTED